MFRMLIRANGFLARRPAQRGSALIEYTIVVGVLLLALVAQPEAVPKLVQALRDAYTSFVYALSISWF